MSQKIKDYYNKKLAEELAIKIQSVFKEFDVQKFLKHNTTSLEEHEYSGRVILIAEALEKTLPSDIPRALSIITSVYGPELETETGMFKVGYWLAPFGKFIERNGVSAPHEALTSIKELTKRYTGEFAIRPLLEHYPTLTLEHIKEWSLSQNVHVRRLASEALRISLPWAKKSTVCIDYFQDYTNILNNIKHDPSTFVQKSVGNNLNDLWKYNPNYYNEMVASLTHGDSSPQLEWILKHGSRSKRKHEV